MRILWLVYERSPHPDAVSFAAGEEDARVVLELFARPRGQRVQIVEQLGNSLQRQHELPLFCREAIPCRRESGLYHLIPWRLAKWLSKALLARESVLETTARRLRNWLDHSADSPMISPT